jgi:predicted nucleic acid-binding protein
MDMIADSGFVFAVFDRTDNHHGPARAFYIAATDRILLPAVALTELAYLFDRMGGNRAVVNAMRGIRQGPMIITDLESSDYGRATEILDKYSDSLIDFVDACIMALAERLTITRILTFDRRDFGLYRPVHCDTFELLP